jgi:hypothetical protein
MSTILFILQRTKDTFGGKALTMPSLSKTMKRTYDNLRRGATRQISDYENRFSAYKNIYAELLANLIRTDFKYDKAWETASNFFGSEKVNFAAVDGTLYSRPLFDMVIFFGGAYASTGSVTFAKDAELKVDYDSKTLEQGIGVSSVVPVYVNEILEIDHSFSSPEQPNEFNPGKQLTDDEIANNSLIANAIMTFGEYYLAYRLAVDHDRSARIILMDRSLSTDRSILLFETRKTDFWIAKSSLLGFRLSETENPVDSVDLSIARQHVFNCDSGLPPTRADYLRYKLISLFETGKTLTLSQVLFELGIEDEKRTQRIELALIRLKQKRILTEANGIFCLDSKYLSSWERMKRITIDVGEKLFFEKSTGTRKASSMKIFKDGKEHWLTTLDIEFLTLFALQMLMEECWKKHILLVGVTKDTAAWDFKRQLLPIMDSEGLLKKQINRKALLELPNTDRMILQAASIFNSEQVKPPWSLVEYDSAFRSMLPDKLGRKGYVSGAIKNKISLERAFLKTYVQLSVAKSDPMLRSNVLLIDRLSYPEYDMKSSSTMRFLNELSDGTREPVDILLFKDKDVPNQLQNIVINILVAMSPKNMPEAFGHNKGLFIADKIAKWNYSQFKCVVDTTAAWILNNHKLRKFIFYMSTFRERRSQIEQNRR